jgi:hypothetical protein
VPKAKAYAEPNNGPEAYHLDPIIDGLLERLPAPGDYWDKAQRKLWLTIIEQVFDLIYDDQPQPEPNEGTATYGGAA